MKSKIAVAFVVLGAVLAAPTVALAENDTYIHDSAHQATEKADFDKAVAKAKAKADVKLQQGAKVNAGQDNSNELAQRLREESMRPGR